jgi:hypothetical protein
MDKGRYDILRMDHYTDRHPMGHLVQLESDLSL